MVIVLSNRDCLVYRWLYSGSYINMNIKQLEKEIIKAVDTEWTILNKLDTHTTLDTLDYSFIDLKKFIKKCFKEYKNED